VGRQFQQSVRSIDGPPLSRKNRHVQVKPQRREFDVAELAAIGDNPADVVQVKHDLAYVLRKMSKRDQAMVFDLARGETTQATAVKYDVSEGRVSQVRRKVLERWNAL